jgi:hypothetical protein
MAQITYNRSKNTTTGMTPFFANYKKELEIKKNPLPPTYRSHQTNISADKIKTLHKNLQLDINFINEKIRYYYDLRRQKASDFKKRKKVYLLQRHIKTKRSSKKLDHKKLGPFKILKKIGTLNYKLQLPTTIRIHPVFHVSLLEKANQNARQAKIEIDGKEEYEVKKILEEALIKEGKHYLVK